MDSKDKFTNKVGEYLKYRPSYPQEFIDYLTQAVGITKDSIVADIGAGTGILTKQLGDEVKTIFAVEPNLNMRTAGQEYCCGLKNLFFIDGTAEDTGLAADSVDFITVAQAFHWFDRAKSKRECKRILKRKGRVILVWNRREAESELIKENDALCRRICPEYKGFSGGHGTSPDIYRDFFKNGYCDYKVFANDRLLTLESFIGGNLSASYAPSKGDTNYRPLVEALTELFHKYSNHGKLLLPNKTHSYVGEVG
jgi:SAM-dependent methyltransferase